MVGNLTVSVFQDPAQPRACVTAKFPWGKTRALTYDARSGLWNCRFRIPAGVCPCEVVVAVIHPDGRQEQQTASFESRAPRARATTRLRSGRLQVDVVTGSDTRRVLAALDDGRWLDLRRVATDRWAGEAPGPARWVDLTFFDNGNHGSTLHLEVSE